MAETPREDHVYMAKLAEQAERYDDMVTSMKEVRAYFFVIFHYSLIVAIGHITELGELEGRFLHAGGVLWRRSNFPWPSICTTIQD